MALCYFHHEIWVGIHVRYPQASMAMVNKNIKTSSTRSRWSVHQPFQMTMFRPTHRPIHVALLGSIVLQLPHTLTLRELFLARISQGGDMSMVSVDGFIGCTCNVHIHTYICFFSNPNYQSPLDHHQKTNAFH